MWLNHLSLWFIAILWSNLNTFVGYATFRGFFIQVAFKWNLYCCLVNKGLSSVSFNFLYKLWIFFKQGTIRLFQMSKFIYELDNIDFFVKYLKTFIKECIIIRSFAKTSFPKALFEFFCQTIKEKHLKSIDFPVQLWIWCSIWGACIYNFWVLEIYFFSFWMLCV